MKIRNTYDYIFYRWYKQSMKTPHRSKLTSAFMAAASTGAVVFLNALFIVTLFEKNALKNYSWVSELISFALIAFVCYYFMNNKRYLRIEERYSSESPQNRQYGIMFTILYFIGSFLVLLFV